MSELLNKTFTLLDLLKPRDGHIEWGAAELARMAGYNTATTHRILKSLQKYEMVNQNPQTKKFHLGSALIELGYLAKDLFSSISDFAKPEMDILFEKTNEGIHLNILHGQNEAILIDFIESSFRLRVTEQLGLRLPLHVGAVRKVILAYMKPEEQEKYIANCNWEARTPNTDTNEKKLRENIADIKAQGFAVSHGETTLGTVGIAVPIFETDGVVGSLSIVVPDVRANEEIIPEYAALLLQSAYNISKKMNGDFWIKHYELNVTT
ncbi:IclR family transcriptional regulator [Sporosarcina sp. FSL W7-1349]|uniref:IclR family transcriptional regulator n=1 Tax=Sporosarcina sp. FSL W7-1349 TaxID=2921561 RepID=UPI0030F71CB3